VSAEQWQRLRAAYDALIDAPGSERARLLAELSAGDPALGRELARLLAAESSPGFLDTPLARLAAARLEPGLILVDRFELLRPIGQGGMGEVWAARDRKLQEDVAIKMVRVAGEAAPDLRRFTREIQLARRISHPNVCRVYEFFEDGSASPPRAFLTMELLEGETLAARLRRQGPMPAGEALVVFRQIALGLAAAHDAGVIHRDLKPANIMLMAGSSSRQAVVMDFGLARGHVRVESDGATTPGTLVGTPEYMAPEQVSGGDLTPATDIYALGLMLFEILRGTRPFASSSTLDSWMRRAREGPERLSGAVPGVQARVDDVIRRCLEYEPPRRPQSVEQLLRALDSSLYIPVPRSRRFWTVAAAAALIVAAAGGIFAWSRLRPALPPAEAMKWYEDAQEALAEGATVRALNAINRAIELAPEFAPSHAALAEIRLELDMPGAAQEAMLRANERSRDRARIPDEYLVYMDGVQAVLQHDCQSAVDAFRRLAEAGTAATRPHRMVLVARTLERCARPDEALSLMTEAARLDSRNAAFMLRAARLAAHRRDYSGAEDSLVVAERLFLDRGNLEGAGDVLILRGTLEAEQDLLDRADATLARAAEIARGLDEARQSIRVLIQRAIVRRKRGDVEGAASLTQEAITLGRQHGLETLTLEGLHAGGNIHVVRGESDEARKAFERVLEIATTHRHDEYKARAHFGLATAYVRIPDPIAAERELGIASHYYRSIGETRTLARAELLLGQIDMMRGRNDEAIATLGEALSGARGTKDQELEVLCLENLAAALVAAARYGEALALYRDVEARHQASGRTRSEAFAQFSIADVLSRMGRSAAAEPVLSGVREAGRLGAGVASQLDRVRATMAFRRGRYAAAIAAAERVVGGNLPPSHLRVVHMNSLICVAAARLDQRGRSDQACGLALSRTNRDTHATQWWYARLSAAEARMIAGDGDSAARLLADVAPILDSRSDQEERWRWLALRSGVMPRDEGARRALTRELDRLRLKWQDGPYMEWRRRADVVALLKPLDIEEGK
jgi:tetratricopeptide (TPR) repeat protein